jgi:phage baseplate assembly protein V
MGPSDVKKMMERALSGVRKALRGRLLRANAAKRVILVQAEGVAGESFNAAEFFQQPGLRSVPIAGMQTIVIPLHGKSAHGVVVAVSNGAAYVTNLQAGEVALFNEIDGEANCLVLRNGRIAELKTGTLNITATEGVNIDTPVMHNTGDVVAGTVSLQNHRTTGVAAGSDLSGPPEQ